MTRTIIPVSTMNRLQELSRDDGRSMAWHIRRALIEYLERVAPVPAPRPRQGRGSWTKTKA